jgi:hypothetical protein
MLIHPWYAPRDDAEWQQWLAAQDFGQLSGGVVRGQRAAQRVHPEHVEVSVLHIRASASSTWWASMPAP